MINATTNQRVAQKAKDLLDHIIGEKDDVIIELELWRILSRGMVETIADVESWEKADMLEEILQILDRHFEQSVRRIAHNRLASAVSLARASTGA